MTVDSSAMMRLQRTIYRAGTSRFTQMLGIVIALLMVFTLALPAVLSREQLGFGLEASQLQMPPSGPSIKGFERFEKFKTQVAAVREQTVTEGQLETKFDDTPGQSKFGVDLVECNEIKMPDVPTNFPDWVTTIGQMQANAELEELIPNVFIKGEEMVIMKCDFPTLFDAIDYTEPAFKPDPARGLDDNPTWDIYLFCGTAKQVTIKFEERIDFGRKAKGGYGTFRLLALKRNIFFDGQGKTGLLRVEDGAHLTVFGITFINGSVVSNDLGLTGMPRGGYQGAGILCMIRSSLIVYHCKFENNQAISTSARFGGGGAIKGETHSKIIVWGTMFKKNRASVGGAIAVSSATVLYVTQSTFEMNEAIGGLDGSANNKGRARPKLLVKGGAVRVDSIEGHESDAEHVLFCNSKFQYNKVIFQHGDYARLGLTEAQSKEDLNCGAAAVYTWNANDNLKVAAGDVHFLTMKGCIFLGNKAIVDTPGPKAGVYVFQAEGAGHAGIHDLQFTNNLVYGAVAKFDNSDKYVKGHNVKFVLDLQNIKFENNGASKNLAFDQSTHNSQCKLKNVSGLPDGAADCTSAAEKAASHGDEITLATDEQVLDDTVSSR